MKKTRPKHPSQTTYQLDKREWDALRYAIMARYPMDVLSQIYIRPERVENLTETEHWKFTSNGTCMKEDWV